MKIKIYGSRGTIPFFGGDNIRYGGNTLCVRVDVAGHMVVIDCGSGFFQLGEVLKKEAADGGVELDILLSHLHLDHIIGLSAFDSAWYNRNNVKIFTASRSEQPLVSQIFGVFKPPYFPVDLSKTVNAELIEINEDEPFRLGADIEITPFAANHLDRTTAFRINCVSEGKSAVYLLDNEIGGNLAQLDKLADYCRNADTVIFDSSYLPEDYDSKRGWGHSTYREGISLAEKCSCKRMIFAHFSQDYSDCKLDAIADGIEHINAKYFLAFDGMEI